MQIQTDAKQAAVRQRHALVGQSLVDANAQFRGSGGVSDGNRSAGFVPAFFDHSTRQGFVSRFADGRPAPFHLQDGLPAHLLRPSQGRGDSPSIAGHVESGFVRGGRFYSRLEAAAAVRAPAYDQ